MSISWMREKNGSRRATSYAHYEEIQVCQSQMHINKNPIVGAQQNISKFYNRIEDPFKVAMLHKFWIAHSIPWKR